jgi:hypothetical protein
MTRTEHLLEILHEECDETGQRCSKALRFGLSEVQPEQRFTNAFRILQEFYDAVAVVEMLQAEYVLPVLDAAHIEELKAAKKAKVEKFFEISIEQGTLTDAARTAHLEGVLTRIVNRYEGEQEALGHTPCEDSKRWGLPWAMYTDAKDGLK